MRPLLERIRREEGGAVIVTVAVFLPVAIALAAFVIDIGNAMEHRRHLQLQADASALAAAQEFNKCRTAPTVADANGDIRQVAINYAKDRNPLLGDAEAQGRVDVIVNDDPCGDRYVDVKLVERDSPAFFDFVGDHDYQADARVQVAQIEALNGLLPLAVPVPDPTSAWAIFVNELTGEWLRDSNENPLVARLEPAGAAPPLGLWQTSAIDVPIGTEHVGVRIALSGASSKPESCDDPQVTCYDAESANGLSHIRGWSGAAKGATDPPVVRSVSLVDPGSGCDNPYFSSPSVPCAAFDISAIVDFGGDPDAVNGDVTAAVVGRTPPRSYDLSPDGTDPAQGAWTSDESIPVTAGEGPVEIELTVEWETETTSNNPNCKKNCTTTETHEFTQTVQRHFAAADDRSGPIELLEVSEGGDAHANSLAVGEHSLNVKIGISGTLAAGGPHYLRMSQGSGSQTQTLDCNANQHGDVQVEVELGCNPWYRPNDEGITCPHDVWELDRPWPCVQVTPGDRLPQIAKGLNNRILGSENPSPSDCPDPGDPGYNNWPEYPAGDKRLVYVVQTEFGAFDQEPTGSGGNVFSVPVTALRAFYIIGWQGQNDAANPCNDPELQLEPGDVVGYYVPDVKTPNEGGAGDELCTFEGFTPCTAVLVN